MRAILMMLYLALWMVACDGSTSGDEPSSSDTGSAADTGADSQETATAASTDEDPVSDTASDTPSETETPSATSSEENEDPNAEVYGLIDVALRSDFVIDADLIDDVAYQDEHLDQIATLTPAFTGTVAGMTIPAAEATDYEILVLRGQSDKGGFFRIVQFAYNGMTLINPVIELALPTDAYETGDSIGVCIGQSVIFTVYDLSASFQKKCVHAISGDAALTVDLAEELSASDGGKLHLSGADIPVYYIAKTPHGDLSAAMDAPACDEQP